MDKDKRQKPDDKIIFAPRKPKQYKTIHEFAKDFLAWLRGEEC